MFLTEEQAFAKPVVSNQDEESRQRLANINLLKNVPDEFKEAVNKVESIAQNTIIEGEHDYKALPPIITAAWRSKFKQVRQLLISLQLFYHDRHFYVWDVDLRDDQKAEVSETCI